MEKTHYKQTDLPESLKAIIRDFSFQFSEATVPERQTLKENLVRIIVSFYAEYGESLCNEIKIPYFKDFKETYSKIITKYKNEAARIISKHKDILKEYEDIIMENFCLSIQKILIVSEFCYNQTKDLDKVCEIYCILGYPGYSNRFGNKEYLINLISQWITFSDSIGCNTESAKFKLINNFTKLDSDYLRTELYYSNEQCFSFLKKDLVEHLNTLQQSPRHKEETLISWLIKHDQFYSPSDFCIDINNIQKDVNDFEDINSEAISLFDICNYIKDNAENNKSTKELAVYLNLSKLSDTQDLENAVTKIANLFEFVGIYKITDATILNNYRKYFCIKLVPSELSDIYHVRLESDKDLIITSLLLSKERIERGYDPKIRFFVINGYVYYPKPIIDNSYWTYWNNTIVLDNTGKYCKFASEDIGEFIDGLYVRYDEAYYNELPYLTLLCNYYIYIFDKASSTPEHQPFAAYLYKKWLLMNYDSIIQLIPDITEQDINSLLLDYAVHKLGTLCAVPKNSYSGNVFMHYGISSDELKIANLIYDLKEKRQITRYELADLWRYIVLESDILSSSSNIVDNPKCTEIKESQYPEDGEFLLPWKYVRYADGKVFFYHPNHERGANAILPYIHMSDDSKREFFYISKNIIWRFPFIRCICKRGKIIKIDEQAVNQIISAIKSIYHDLEKHESVSELNHSMTANDILLKYKSDQLGYLKIRHLKNYPIIPILERFYSESSNVCREEPSLLFTICKSNGILVLVYENTSISRASFVFIIQADHSKGAIARIKDYFSSNIPNKRSELQLSNNRFSSHDGFMRVIRVVHDDNNNWQSTIDFYSNYRIRSRNRTQFKS